MGQHRAAVPRRRLSAILGLVLLGGASLLTAVPASAQTPTPGQLRLGHLSPSTPAVDIYLGPPGAVALLAGDAGYGAVTGYRSLDPGRYDVELRPAGAAADSAPALTSAVDVAPGSVQSLLFFDTGAGGAAQGQLLADDLTAVPRSGRVRVVQAADGIGPVDVQAAGGPRLATDLAYGTTTDYAVVEARPWDVAIAAGGRTVQAVLDVAAGSVSTVVVTTDPQGALTVTPLVDLPGRAGAGLPGLPELSGPPVAAPGEPAAPPMPQGGVPAGGGATAGGPDPTPVLLGIVGAVLLVFGVSGRPAGRARHR